MGTTKAGWNFIKSSITSMFNSASTTNTFDADKSGFVQGKGEKEGKRFKGGKQSSRDATLNRYPKDFAKWYHRQVKGNSRGDESARELAEWYLEWIKMGKPIPK